MNLADELFLILGYAAVVLALFIVVVPGSTLIIAGLIAAPGATPI